GHGTHVSGTIAGGSTSGTAIGVAPGAKIIMGKMLDSQGSGDISTILTAMQWIADPDGNPATPDAPNIVSNSWGDSEGFAGQARRNVSDHVGHLDGDSARRGLDGPDLSSPSWDHDSSGQAGPDSGREGPGLSRPGQRLRLGPCRRPDVTDGALIGRGPIGF